MAAGDQALLRFHRSGYLALVRERTAAGDGWLDAGDTPARAGLYEAGSYVVGSVLDALARDRGIALQAVSPPHLWVVGDRLALRQALGNLLANAIRVSDEGTTIRVSGGRHDAWVWLAVEDEGPGIPASEHERVFQRFYRGDAGAGRGAARSGLGLTIVRQIAEAHGGEVRLVSEEGRGSAFAIWVPAAADPGPAGPPPPSSPNDG